MKIGGWQKVSLIDFPTKISLIVFTKGCNFRCPFCFNKDLVDNHLPTINSQTILSFLKKRKKILDGVVITGGEPLLQPDLASFLRKIRKLGFKIKLDTNGSQPEKLAKLIQKNPLDYAALDYKVPLDQSYQKAAGLKDFNPALIKQTIKILKKAKTPFELRTTIVPTLHDQKKLNKMAKELKEVLKVKKINWYWQNFQPKNCLDPEFEKIKPFTKRELETFLQATKKHYPDIIIRSI